MKTIAVLLVFCVTYAQAEVVLLAPTGVYPHKYKVKKEFDEFDQDETVEVSMEFTPKDRKGVRGVFGFQCHKNESRVACVVYVGIAADSFVNLDLYPPGKTATLQILCDGKVQKYEGEIKYEAGRVVTETFAAIVPVSFLQHVGHAKKISLRLGVLNFDWTSHERNALCEIASTIERGTYGTVEIKDDPVWLATQKQFAKEMQQEQQAEEQRMKQEMELAQKEKARKQQEKDERYALSKVQLAKRAIHDGNTSLARKFLTDAIDKYPGTKGAEQAAEVLKELKEM